MGYKTSKTIRNENECVQQHVFEYMSYTLYLTFFFNLVRYFLLCLNFCLLCFDFSSVSAFLTTTIYYSPKYRFLVHSKLFSIFFPTALGTTNNLTKITFFPFLRIRFSDRGVLYGCSLVLVFFLPERVSSFSFSIFFF